MHLKCALCTPRWKNFYDMHGKNKMEGVGNPNADIVVVGESPGNDEALAGEPFVGASGMQLNDMLISCGLSRDEVFITNAVRCWDDNRTPNPREIKNCRVFLLHDINTIRPKIIITLGKTALVSLGIKDAMHAAVGKLHRSPYTTVPVFALYHPAYIMRNRGDSGLKEKNYAYFREAVASIGKKPVNGLRKGNYCVVTSLCKAKKARDFLLKCKIFSFDIETTGLDYFNDKKPLSLKSIAFSYGPGKAIVFPTTEDVFNKEELKEILQYLKEILESDVLKVAHNGKFDIGFLQYVCGIYTKNFYFDTLLAAYQIDENNSIDLESCTMRYIPDMAGYDRVIKEKYDGRPDKAYGEDLWYYNGGDADATLRLAKLFYPILAKEKMLWLHQKLLIPATLCFIRMEAYGVKCDRELMRLLERQYMKEKAELIKKMRACQEVLRFEKETGRVYNPNSSSHNRKIFLEYYKLPVLRESEITKEPGIGKEELRIYAEEHDNPLAKIVMQIKLTEKALSTYLTGFYKYLYQEDIAHTQFNLTVAVTGRTSSGGGSSDIKEDEFEDLKFLDVENSKRRTPNLQNINKKNKALRNIIRARDDCYWISADFKQAEVGCGAALSRDKKLLEAYMSEKDLHTQIASLAFDVPYEKVDDVVRREAKACLGENSFVFTTDGPVRPRDLMSTSTNLLTQDKAPQSWRMTVDPPEKTLTVEYNNGIKEEYRPDHKIRVWNGVELVWKEVQHLTKDDEVITQYGHMKGIEKQFFVDLEDYYAQNRCKSKTVFDAASSDWCYFFGLYLGDGYARFSESKISGNHKGATLQIVIKDEAVKDRVFSFFERSMIPYSCRARKAKKGYTYYYVLVHSLGLCSILNRLFPGKSISDEFLYNVGYSGYLSLLAGLMDSDGKLSMKLKCLTNTNEQMIRTVALISNAIGIPTRLTKFAPGITDEEGSRRYTYKNNSEIKYKTCYELFFHEIDVKIPVLTKHKIGKNRKRFPGFSINPELGDKIYYTILELEGGYSKKSKGAVRWDNIRRGKSVVCPNTPYLSLLPELSKDVYISNVVSKEESSSPIYVIQTESGHYVSSCTISHNCTFGIMYGISPVGLAKRIGKPIEEAEKLMQLYFSRFPGLKKMMDTYVQQVDSQGFVESPFHRKRRFPIVTQKSYRQAMNGPIQATSSDILLFSMCKLYDLIDAENLQDVICPVLAVHDELDVEVKRGFIRKGRELITRAMTEEIYKDPMISNCLGPIRLGIDLEISPLEGGWGQHQPLSNFTEEEIMMLDQGSCHIGKDMKLSLTNDWEYDKELAVS